MLIKFLAVAMVVLCGTSCGMSYSDKLRRRVDFCSQAEKMMQLCSIMIRSCGTDVYKLVSRLKSEDYSELTFLNELAEEYSAENEFSSIWGRAVMSCKNTGDEEKCILVEFGNFLGSTDINGQVSGIELQLELMHGIYEQRRSDYIQKGKLYRSLGMLAGVTAGIVII